MSFSLARIVKLLNTYRRFKLYVMGAVVALAVVVAVLLAGANAELDDCVTSMSACLDSCPTMTFVASGGMDMDMGGMGDDDGMGGMGDDDDGMGGMGDDDDGMGMSMGNSSSSGSSGSGMMMMDDDGAACNETTLELADEANMEHMMCMAVCADRDQTCKRDCKDSFSVVLLCLAAALFMLVLIVLFEVAMVKYYKAWSNKVKKNKPAGAASKSPKGGKRVYAVASAVQATDSTRSSAPDSSDNA